MALYKRGNGTFYIKVTHPRTGRTVRLSTRTTDRKKAQEFQDRVKAELWSEAQGQRRRYTWKEAVVRWLTDRASKKTIGQDRGYLRALDEGLSTKYLDEIDGVTVNAVLRSSSLTVRNRMKALIRAILRAAAEDWEWLERAPKIRLEKEPSRRVRYLSREQFETLASHLPPHLADMARFAVNTGVRAGNLVSTRWDQIDLEKRVAWYLDTKNGEPLGVYLNDEAVAAIRRQMGKHPVWVFTYAGRKAGQLSTKAWYRAQEKAGIEDFRWHDLRHTWASWHVQNGTPLYALQEQGGWKSAQMVRRYAHLSAEHFRVHAERISGTKVDTGGNQVLSTTC